MQHCGKRATMLHSLILHLLCQKSGDGLGQALVALAGGLLVFIHQQHDASHKIALGDDGAAMPR